MEVFSSSSGAAIHLWLASISLANVFASRVNLLPVVALLPLVALAAVDGVGGFKLSEECFTLDLGLGAGSRSEWKAVGPCTCLLLRALVKLRLVPPNAEVSWSTITGSNVTCACDIGA